MDEENNIDSTIEDELSNQENRIPSGPIGKKARKEAKKFARKQSKKIRNKIKSTMFKPVGISMFSGFLSVFIIIFMMIGIVSFITSMPGMVQEKIFETVMEKVTSLKYVVNGSDYYLEELARDTNRTKQKEVLKYLDDMDLDPAGFGFAAFYERYTDENGNDIVEYSPNLDDEVIMDDDGGFIDALKYNNKLAEKVKSEDLIFKYIVANERTYLVDDLDKVGNKKWVESISDWVDGLLDVSNPTDLRGMIVTKINGWDDSEITVDRENKQMVISSKNGLSTQKFTYNLEGWTGKYGMPLEFLLALHIGTMSSDLTNEMLSNENLQTEVLVTSEKDNYDAEYQITYKGEQLPITYKPTSVWKGTSAYSDLNDFIEQHLKYDISDGHLYLDATDDEIQEIKEKGLISINSLIGLIQQVRYFGYGYDATKVDIDAAAAYSLEGRKALFGDGMYRVQYKIISTDTSPIVNHPLSYYTAWFGDVGTTYDGKYTLNFPDAFKIHLVETLQNDGGSIYQADDNGAMYIVSNTTDKPIYLNSEELDETGAKRYYSTAAGNSSPSTTTAILHGFQYYLEDDENLQEIKTMDNRIAIACMLIQQDSYLYRVREGRNLSLDSFASYTYDELTQALWNNEIFIENKSGDNIKLYVAHEWLDFWSRTNGNPTNEQLREEIEKIETMLQESFNEIDNTDEYLQDVIDQILLGAYGETFSITDLSIIDVALRSTSSDVEYVQPRIAYVIKHWYKDIIFDGTYKNTGSPIVIPMETDNPDLEVNLILSNGTNYTQTGQPYVVKGDIVTLDGEVVENSGITTVKDRDGNDYTVGDGYRTTKKLFTQGQYYVYDGTQETAKSISYAKELEKINGSNKPKFAKVYVRNGRIVVEATFDNENDAKTAFGDAYDTNTGSWNVSAQEINDARANEKLPDPIQTGDGWSVFLAKASVKENGEHVNVYYIKVTSNLAYKSPANKTIQISRNSVERINTLLDAMGVVTQRKPISFDNTTTAGDVVALTAFSILEGAHSEDAEYVYRDLKEFLIELGYYTKAEFEFIETKVLTWFIPSYIPSTSEDLSSWRQNKDEDALEYGAIIYPEVKDDDGEVIEEGFSSGLEVVAPGNSKVLKVETDATTDISTITLEFDGISEPEIGMLNGYTMIIKGIKLNEDAIKVQNENGVESELSIKQIVNSDNNYIVPVGTVIGYTADVKIQVILKDSKGAFVDNIEDYMGPEIATVSSDSTEFSIVGTVLTESEFVECCLNYIYGRGIVNSDFSESNLKEFYRICKSKGVNPELAFVTAVTESSLTAYEATSTHNYWGLDTPNGSAVPSLGTMLETLELYCDRIVEYQNPYGSLYQMIMERYEERSACTENGGCNPNGYGKPNTLQGLQSIYSYVGDHVTGSAGSGGYYYLDPGVAGFTGIYSTHEEFVAKCKNVHAEGSKATVWEQAQYTAAQVESKIEKAKSIFGEKAGKFVY